MGFSRQKFWSGLPFPSPGDLSDPGIKPGSPALQADFLPSQPPGKPKVLLYMHYFLPLPCDMAQSSTVTGKKGQTNLGSYHHLCLLISSERAPSSNALTLTSMMASKLQSPCQAYSPGQIANETKSASHHHLLLRGWAAQMNHSK